MFGIGGWEMVLICVVALLVFGPQRLPELARSLGKGLAEFRKASSDLRRSIDLDLDPRHTSAPDPASQAPAQTGDLASVPRIHGGAPGAAAPEEASPEGAEPRAPEPQPASGDEATARGD